MQPLFRRGGLLIHICQNSYVDLGQFTELAVSTYKDGPKLWVNKQQELEFKFKTLVKRRSRPDCSGTSVLNSWTTCARTVAFLWQWISQYEASEEDSRTVSLSSLCLDVWPYSHRLNILTCIVYICMYIMHVIVYCIYSQKSKLLIKHM